MKAYIMSVMLTAIAVTLGELALPDGKMKSTAKILIAIAFIGVIVAPVIKFDFDSFTNESFLSDDNRASLAATVDGKLGRYYEEDIKSRLLENDLVAEKVVVEIEEMNFKKAEIYLSNLVFDENSEHIN